MVDTKQQTINNRQWRVHSGLSLQGLKRSLYIMCRAMTQWLRHLSGSYEVLNPLAPPLPSLVGGQQASGHLSEVQQEANHILLKVPFVSSKACFSKTYSTSLPPTTAMKGTQNNIGMLFYVAFMTTTGEGRGSICLGWWKPLYEKFHSLKTCSQNVMWPTLIFYIRNSVGSIKLLHK